MNRTRQPPSRKAQLVRHAKLEAYYKDNPIDFEAVRKVEVKWAPILGHDCCHTREEDFE